MKKNIKQLRLFTVLGNVFSPERETADMRIMVLDSLARQWYGDLQKIDNAQCPECTKNLYFHWNYLNINSKAIAYCRNCGWFTETVLT